MSKTRVGIDLHLTKNVSNISTLEKRGRNLHFRRSVILFMAENSLCQNCGSERVKQLFHLHLMDVIWQIGTVR